MNKGFSLMELLAVIAILAIIAVITTPIISGVFEDARKNTFESSVEEIINIVKMDYNEYGRMGEVEYSFDESGLKCVKCDGENDVTLDYTGDLNATGKITYNNGSVTLENFKNNEFEATYNNGVEINKIEKKEE